MVVVEYVSKWVEVVSLSNNKGKSITTFLKRNIFSQFGTLHIIISGGGSHFWNYLFKALLDKYGVRNKVEIPYHPHTNGQEKVSNREIKSILAKTMNANRTDWSRILDDALWDYQIAYNTPIGSFLYYLVYGKACHLLVEFDHKELWALKRLNFEWRDATNLRLNKVNELDEFWLRVYESLAMERMNLSWQEDQDENIQTR